MTGKTSILVKISINENARSNNKKKTAKNRTIMLSLSSYFKFMKMAPTNPALIVAILIAKIVCAACPSGICANSTVIAVKNNKMYKTFRYVFAGTM